jgi:ADP-heptose:LPS heptosyltransferase
VVQLGGKDEQLIPGTTDRRGHQDIRRSICLLKLADLHIGIVSSLMHAAQATGTKAIILFGGFERYTGHGYSMVTPIESTVDCSPCARPGNIVEPCPRNNRCMEEIQPDTVYTKACELLFEKGFNVSTSSRKEQVS